MVDPFALVLSVGLGLFLVTYANRAVRAAWLLWAIRWDAVDDALPVVDGEPAAVEGEVVVDDPAFAADRVVGASEHRATGDDDRRAGAVDATATDGAVGAYLWRAAFSNGKNVVDVRDRTVRDGRVTIASGIEAGRFGVDGDRQVRVDPSWLVDTHRGARLSAVDLDGWHSHLHVRIPLWESPAVHLAGVDHHGTLAQVAALVGDDPADLERYHLESRPIREGDTLAVYGELRVDAGDPVLVGSDAHPLAISNRGFDGLRTALRRAVLRHGLVAGFLGVLVAAVWYVL